MERGQWQQKLKDLPDTENFDDAIESVVREFEIKYPGGLSTDLVHLESSGVAQEEQHEDLAAMWKQDANIWLRFDERFQAYFDMLLQARKAWRDGKPEQWHRIEQGQHQQRLLDMAVRLRQELPGATELHRRFMESVDLDSKIIEMIPELDHQ